MEIDIESSLSFDDVLLKPQKFHGDSRNELNISTYVGNVRLEIPIIAANMPSVCETKMAVAMGRLGGLGIIHRMQPIERQVSQVQNAKATLRVLEGWDRPVGAAIGIGNDWLERAIKLIHEAETDIICLDVAHGHTTKVIEIIKAFKLTWPNVTLIAGNIATSEAAIELSSAGANALKVGVGGGSVCTTRIKTGCGVPTFQSVIECNRGRSNSNQVFHIIADGGIKNSGDIIKALAGGSHAVMLGSLLAGTNEAPGEIIKAPDGNKYKIYRGAASYGAKKEFFGKTEYIEGEETLVPYRGPVSKIVTKLCEGIRSGLSYNGAQNIFDLQTNANFIRITNAGMKESKAHGLL